VQLRSPDEWLPPLVELVLDGLDGANAEGGATATAIRLTVALDSTAGRVLEYGARSPPGDHGAGFGYWEVNANAR
jgi:hypothetical protein